MYKVTDVIEAQTSNKIGITLFVGNDNGVKTEDVVTISISAYLKNYTDFENIATLFEGAIRKHIRNRNLHLRTKP